LSVERRTLEREPQSADQLCLGCSRARRRAARGARRPRIAHRSPRVRSSCGCGTASPSALNIRDRPPAAISFAMAGRVRSSAEGDRRESHLRAKSGIRAGSRARAALRRRPIRRRPIGLVRRRSGAGTEALRPRPAAVRRRHRPFRRTCLRRSSSHHHLHPVIGMYRLRERCRSVSLSFWCTLLRRICGHIGLHTRCMPASAPRSVGVHAAGARRQVRFGSCALIAHIRALSPTRGRARALAQKHTLPRTQKSIAQTLAATSVHMFNHAGYRLGDTHAHAQALTHAPSRTQHARTRTHTHAHARTRTGALKSTTYQYAESAATKRGQSRNGAGTNSQKLKSGHFVSLLRVAYTHQGVATLDDFVCVCRMHSALGNSKSFRMPAGTKHNLLSGHYLSKVAVSQSSDVPYMCPNARPYMRPYMCPCIYVFLYVSLYMCSYMCPYICVLICVLTYFLTYFCMCITCVLICVLIYVFCICPYVYYMCPYPSWDVPYIRPYYMCPYMRPYMCPYICVPHIRPYYSPSTM